MKSIRSCLHRAARRSGLDRCWSSRFDENAAHALRRERVTVVMDNLAQFSLGLIFLGGFMAWWFWGHGRDVAIAAWYAAIVGLSLVPLIYRYYRESNRPFSGSKKATRSVVVQTMLAAAIWSSSFFIFIPIAEGADALFINGCSVGGMIFGPMVLYAMPRAVTAWLTTSLIMNTAAFLLAGDPAYVAAGLLNIAFTATAGYSVTVQAIRFVDEFEARRSLREQQDLNALLLEEYENGSNAWLWECDRHGTLVRSPDALRQLVDAHCTHIGLPAGQPLGIALIAAAGPSGYDRTMARYLWHKLKAHQPFNRLRLPLMVEASDVRWLELSGKPILDSQGKVAGFRGLASDITEIKCAEDRVRYLAAHDHLTGLPNRTTYSETIDPWAANGRRFVAIHLDLDRFKMINDAYGHSAGDGLLVRVSERLQDCLEGSGEQFVAARIGGDEFVAAILFDHATSVENAVGISEAVSGRIVERLSEPFELREGTVTIGASVGYAIFPDDVCDPRTLSQRVDLALYAAKNQGRGQYRRFRAEMDRSAETRKSMEEQLRLACERGELHLVYQPIVDLDNGRTLGAEALLRWTNESLGPVGPDQFIPVAEESGLIHEIGAWALHNACEEAARWQRSDLTIAVNISAKQIVRPGFYDIVGETLRKTGLLAGQLELELTESILVEDTEIAIEIIAQLRELGVRVVLDDFGTGYSSLSYLRTFIFDKIKIDRSFVRSMTPSNSDHTASSATLIEAIISMSRTLGMDIVAEGIEEGWQADDLRSIGCCKGQGFLFSHPVSADRLRTVTGFDTGETSYDEAVPSLQETRRTA